MIAVEEAAETGNVHKTAQKWGVYPYTIRKWRKNYVKLKAAAERLPRNVTVRSGPKSKNTELERTIYEWVLKQRKAELALITSDIIDKALSLDPQFKYGNQVTLGHWVYRFLKRHQPSVRTRTRVSQITNFAMKCVRRDYCRRLMTSFRNRINDPRFLINMDETAIYLDCYPNRTVHIKGEKTVSVIIGGVSSIRFTLAITITMDGTKLPLFVIFKGVPGGHIERQLPRIVPKGIIGCVQKKGWMHNRIMRIWYEKIFKPYVDTAPGETGILLDDFICRKYAEIKSKLTDNYAMLYIIQNHYTNILQPSDVGINKSLKDRLKKASSQGRQNRHDVLTPGVKLPAPKCFDVLTWLKKVWNKFPAEIVRNSFKGYGYVFEDTVDYSMATESESEME